MKFNDFAKAALSNDIICIMDDVYSHEGKIIGEPEAAFRMIDGKYANMEIDRLTMIPRTDGVKGKMLAVSFKEPKTYVFIRDENNFKDIVFEGTREECEKFIEENGDEYEIGW